MDLYGDQLVEWFKKNVDPEATSRTVARDLFANGFAVTMLQRQAASSLPALVAQTLATSDPTRALDADLEEEENYPKKRKRARHRSRGPGVPPCCRAVQRS